MRAAVPHFVLGVILIVAGVGITLATEGQMMWWGAVVAGIISIIWGIVVALRAPRYPDD